MKMRLIVMLLVGLMVLPALAAPTYPCYRPAVAPVIDGEIAGDPAWQSIPSATGFFILGNGYSYAKQTIAQCCWTEAGLFFGVTCEERDAKRLKPQVLDGGDTWAEDGIEIFVQPAGRPDVYQFAITAGGAKAGFEGNPDYTKMKAASKIADGAYYVETLIPWEIVRGKAGEGVKWGGNICRNIFTTNSGGDKFTSWAPLQSRFLEPENFATIVFHDGKVAPADVLKITEQLNGEYRGTLLKQVAAAIKTFDEYREGLQLASQDAKYADQAQGLLAEWQKLEAINREAERASILDMRAALMKLDALNRDSYEVKYRYLIYRLMQEN